jgi:hypothetical protein
MRSGALNRMGRCPAAPKVVVGQAADRVRLERHQAREAYALMMDATTTQLLRSFAIETSRVAPLTVDF